MKARQAGSTNAITEWRYLHSYFVRCIVCGPPLRSSGTCPVSYPAPSQLPGRPTKRAVSIFWRGSRAAVAGQSGTGAQTARKG